MTRDPLIRPLAERTYTGVGSRSTPAHVLALMTQIALKLAADTHYVLRSGAAEGADTAFALGAGGQAEIYLPWRTFGAGQHPWAHIMVTGDDPAAAAIAEHWHPAWERCKRGARALHSRNVHQLLGRDLDRPSQFLLCWTPAARPVGGTATALILAAHYGVPIWNLADDAQRLQWMEWVLDRAEQNPYDTITGLVQEARLARTRTTLPVTHTAKRTVFEMRESDMFWKSLDDINERE